MSEKSKIGQTVAALGVIASLGLVAFEVRENTRAVRSQTLQAISEQATQLSFIGVENPELRSALGKTVDGDYSDLTPSESSILTWYYSGVMRVAENRFRQFTLGILDEQSLQQLGGHAPVFRYPYFRDWWPDRKYQFPPDFVEYVEVNLLPLELPGR